MWSHIGLIEQSAGTNYCTLSEKYRSQWLMNDGELIVWVGLVGLSGLGGFQWA